jgi:protein gp37
MADKTKIEWTEASWNPIAAFTKYDLWVAPARVEAKPFDGGTPVPADTRGWFCTKVSPGCAGCYAEGINIRLGNGLPYTLPNLKHIEFRLVNLDQPLRWKRPRQIFVCSMCDIFHEALPIDLIAPVFAVMALAGQHVFQVLTKRADRMRAIVSVLDIERCIAHLARVIPIVVRAKALRSEWTWPLPNVALGVSAEDQQRLEERVRELIATPAAARFLSCEPLLGPIDLYTATKVCWSIPSKYRHWQDAPASEVKWAMQALLPVGYKPAVHWVIVGGESGPRARMCDADWIRNIIAQCRAAGVRVFVKQLGATNGQVWGPSGAGHGRPFAIKHRKGGDPAEWPEDLRVREPLSI